MPDTRRRRLSLDRVLHAAIRVADRSGPEAITMRKVAQELGVEAMSLYHYVPNKDTLLDAVVDAVFTAIDVPVGRPEDWRQAIRSRAGSARAVLSRHSWALGLMDSRRNPGPATLHSHNAVLGILREAGFSLPMAAHAISLIDSYTYGFVLQQTNLPIATPDDVRDVADSILQHLPDGLPYLREMIVDHALQPGYDHTDEFDFGLQLILDGLEARRTAGVGPPGAPDQ